MLSFEEGKGLILERAKSLAGSLGTETVPLDQALNRVLAEDLIADRDYPPFNRSAMDGYAIYLEENEELAHSYALVGEVFAGDAVDLKIEPRQCIKIMTGAAVPKGLNCVIKVEEAKEQGGQVSFATEKAKPWANIARQGEDAAQGIVMHQAGAKIDLAMVTTLATCGYGQVKVYKKPTVAIITTGNEVVGVEKTPGPAEIRNSNRQVLLYYLQQLGIEPSYVHHAQDDRDDIAQAIEKALNYNIVMLCGGVSMGDADFVPELLAKAGVEKVFHKLKVRPGKPLWFGKKDRDGGSLKRSSGPKGLQETVGQKGGDGGSPKPSSGPEGLQEAVGKKDGSTTIFGLPGNPVSTQMGFKVFIEDFINVVMGLPAARPMVLPLGNPRKKKSPFSEFFAVGLNDTGDALIPKPSRGSGDIAATLETIGLAIQPADKVEIAVGEKVRFLPWRPL